MAEKTNVSYDTISRLSVSSQSIFSKCCCCIPLRIGCFILGYLNLVVNCFQIMALIALTTFIGVSTHGFDHFDPDSMLNPHTKSNYLELLESTTESPELKGLDHMFLTTVGFILAVLLVANALWMIISIACLVGLHKKRPGPIRVYVGFATARLLLAMAGFIYLVMSHRVQTQSIVVHSFDLALSAYFIMVYYIYAVQLEKERELVIAQPAPVNNDFLYPTKLDKSHLVA